MQSPISQELRKTTVASTSDTIRLPNRTCEDGRNDGTWSFDWGQNRWLFRAKKRPAGLIRRVENRGPDSGVALNSHPTAMDGLCRVPLAGEKAEPDECRESPRSNESLVVRQQCRAKGATNGKG